MPNFRGVAEGVRREGISVELGDKRVMDFKRTDKTKFFKNGDEVKTPNFAVGDQVSVEAHGRAGRIYDRGQRRTGKIRRRRDFQER